MSILPAYVRAFISSNVTAYIMEMGQYYIRFYRNRAQILLGSVPYQIITPWLSADIPYLKMAQSLDVMYMTSRNYPIQKLLHYADTNWVLEQVPFEDGPYRDENIDGVTFLQPSATTGTGITLTATYRGLATGTGTSSGTPGTPVAAFQGSGTAFVGFQFTTPAGPQQFSLNSATFNVAVGPATNDVPIDGFLVPDASGSPNMSAIVSTANPVTIQVGASGVFDVTFQSAPSLTASTAYWVVLEATAFDAAVTLATVTLNASYGSGIASTGAGITNSLGVSLAIGLNSTGTGASAGSVFYPGHVGSLWRLKYPGPTSSYTFTSVGQTSPPVLMRGQFTVDATPIIPPTQGAGSYFVGEVVLQNSTDLAEWIDVASFFYSTTQTFVETKSNVYYRLYCKQRTAGREFVTITQAEAWGTFQATAYVSPTQLTGNVLFPFQAITPTPWWREGEWSLYRGFPEAIVFHDNRLWFGRDLTVWGSWVGDFENFNPDGDTDDQAVTFSPSQLANNIEWLESIKGLMVGSLGQEGRMTGANSGPITPSSIQCEIQSTIGCAQYPEPVGIGQAALFVQLDRRRIREFVYDLATDGFKSPDLAIRAEDITVGGIFDMCYQQFPNSILFAVRGDGVLLGMTYYREEDVVAWHQHTTQGVFNSCAVIPSSTGIYDGYDELWVTVTRTLNGVTQQFVEVMANHEAVSVAPRQVTDFFMLDCGTHFDFGSTPGTVLTGLDRFDGMAVTVVADGTPLDDQVYIVSGGTLTLNNPVTICDVGLGYSCILGTMPWEVPQKDGYSMGRNKSVYQIVLRLLESLGGQVGPDLNNLRDIPYRTPQNLLGVQVPLFTGLMKPSFSDNSDDISLWVVQPLPLPITLLAAGILCEVGD